MCIVIQQVKHGASSMKRGGERTAKLGVGRVFVIKERIVEKARGNTAWGSAITTRWVRLLA